MCVKRRLVVGSILVALVASLAVVFSGAPASAEIVQGFTGDFPVQPVFEPFRKWLQNGADPPPRIMDDDSGWDGPYGRVTEEVNSQNNSVAWDQLISGTFDSLTIGMDIRVSVGNNGGADGFGLAYLNTANYGTSTFDATPAFSEEPNLAGSLGVGFDTWNNGVVGGDHEGGNEFSSLSLHYDGALVVSALVAETAIPTFETGEVYRAEVMIEESGGEYVATVSLDDGVNRIEPISAVVVPGFVPYDGRVALAGRTGGANSDQDVDNISIQHILDGVLTDVLVDDFTIPDPEPPEPAPPATLVGGSPYTATTYNGVGPLLEPEVPGAVGVQPGFMRVVSEANDQIGQIAFDGAMSGTIRASFDLRGLNEDTSRADGGNFLLAATGTYGETGEVGPPGAMEEPDLAGVLGVGFDTYEPDGEPDVGIAGPTGNHVSLHWDGAVVGRVAYALDDLDLVNGEFNEVEVLAEVADGGVNVTVSITDGTDGSVHVPFDNVFVAGATLDSVRPAFGFRTGGAMDHYDVDNVVVVPEPGVLSLLGMGAASMALIGIWRRRRRP